MECNTVQNQLIDYIEGNLSKKDANEFITHIESCDSCKMDVKEMRQLLSEMSNSIIEHPSEGLRSNFEQMLADENKSKQAKIVKLQSKTNWKSYLRIAASIALIFGAYFFGKYQTNNPKETDLVLNEQKIKDQKSLLAMIENQSASKRIQAVNNSEKFEKTDTKIIQAIINRMFFDENTNVRLAAAEALSKFASLEMVKSALIKSLETEQSAIVQIELIQILAKIQEKRALEPMKRLLNKKDVPNYLKQELQYNISSLL